MLFDFRKRQNIWTVAIKCFSVILIPILLVLNKLREYVYIILSFWFSPQMNIYCIQSPYVMQYFSHVNQKKMYQRDWILILKSNGLENSTFPLNLSIVVTCYNECHVFFCFFLISLGELEKLLKYPWWRITRLLELRAQNWIVLLCRFWAQNIIFTNSANNSQPASCLYQKAALVYFLRASRFLYNTYNYKAKRRCEP